MKLSTRGSSQRAHKRRDHDPQEGTPSRTLKKRMISLAGDGEEDGGNLFARLPSGARHDQTRGQSTGLYATKIRC